MLTAWCGGVFLPDGNGRCLSAWQEKMSSTSITRDGFARGGEKRGKAQGSVVPQAAICDVFCDLGWMGGEGRVPAGLCAATFLS